MAQRSLFRVALVFAIVASPCLTVSAGCSGSSSTSTVANPAESGSASPVGDGKTDDYAAIQAEIDSAGNAGGGVVSLPAGTFLINGHLLMRSNVTLQGVGPSTIIKAGPIFLQTTGPKGGYPVISTLGATNVAIRALTADQSGDTLNGNLPGRLDEYLIDVRQSNNATVDGVYTTNPFSYSIAVVGSSHFTITNCHTQVTTNGKYNQLDGIHIMNSSYGIVTNNTVDQGIGTDGDDGLVAHTISGSTHDVDYTDNTVRGGRNGAAMNLASGASTDTIYNITIQNNLFWGSARGIHDGTYSGPGGTISEITIGGSSTTGNCFINNGGNAVDLSGNLVGISVTYNTAQDSGAFDVGAGNHIVVANNITNVSGCPSTVGVQAAVAHVAMKPSL